MAVSLHQHTHTHTHTHTQSKSVHTSTASINAVFPSAALASISALPYVIRFSSSRVVYECILVAIWWIGAK